MVEFRFLMHRESVKNSFPLASDQVEYLELQYRDSGFTNWQTVLIIPALQADCRHSWTPVCVGTGLRQYRYFRQCRHCEADGGDITKEEYETWENQATSLLGADNNTRCSITVDDLNIVRQWFTALQDVGPDYLTDRDYDFARKIYEKLGLATARLSLRK